MLRDEKAKVLKGIRPLRPQDVVRGQMRGYRDEAGVQADSKTETFVALRLEINSWRWKGVPFYIRAGKNLPVTATEVIVKLRQPPAVFTELPPSGQLFSLSRDARFDDRGKHAGQESGRAARRATGRTRDQPAVRSRRDGSLRGITLRRGARKCRSALRAKTMSKRHGGSWIPFWAMRLLFTSTNRAHGGRQQASALIAPDGGWFDPTL